jgi:PTS system cellobiose-specific IIB component
MKKIRLFCAAGMSTSLLVKRMQEYDALKGYDYDIAAFAIADAQQKGTDADVILLGPQVRFDLKKIKAMFPDKTVESIDMHSYGMMDGKAVVEQCRKLMQEA